MVSEIKWDIAASLYLINDQIGGARTHPDTLSILGLLRLGRVLNKSGLLPPAGHLNGSANKHTRVRGHFSEPLLGVFTETFD